jgi:hypothetical protein
MLKTYIYFEKSSLFELFYVTLQTVRKENL